ncbi:TM1812 family CRISPR-associated protein [Alicyclobacillus mali]|uniref:TM1812 family CRISPR-associated protein n=1 Tax=Alicyclobacillus mali (ex Roth et al. 2021) TaxID=1123961 RepID=A0ABS0F6W2_9BACL|nr:TM1812 family CRISPR-associated protein [Alicyclobacillus mali (ex Roth et al. 2021)]MBF8379039.1 TM1812 family CRISPR-associated protein [Alicyclobacillus mali (ex Roth et al. 2021)]
MTKRCIYLTFVGGNVPRETNYRWGDEVSTNRYFQLTALDWMRRSVIPFHPDEVWVVLTKRARELWGTAPEEGKLSLREQLYAQAEHMGILIKEVDFDQEPCDQSVWRNFDVLVRKLAEVSEDLRSEAEVRLAVDVTHSFRYFPMLVLTLLHYAHVVQGAELDLILYAVETGDVLDLTALAQLQQWVLEMHRALKGPDASGVERLVREVKESVAGRDRSRRSLLGPLQTFSEKWNMLWEALRLTKHFEVSSAASATIEALEECERCFMQHEDEMVDFLPLSRILKQVREQIEPLCEKEWMPLMLAMVRWYLDRGMIHQAYTTMRELYITEACILAGVNVFDHDKREALKNLAYAQRGEAKRASDENESFFAIISELSQEQRADISAFQNQFNADIDAVSQYRNQLNHGFFQKNLPKTRETKFRDRLLEFVRHLEDFKKPREGGHI